jgi:hypothetical protein
MLKEKLNISADTGWPAAGFKHAATGCNKAYVYQRFFAASLPAANEIKFDRLKEKLYRHSRSRRRRRHRHRPGAA